MPSSRKSPRIRPVEPPYSPAIEEMLKKWMKGRPADMEPLKIFRTFAVHEDLAPRTGVLGAGLLGHPRITPREREVIIHRITARAGAEYEWGVHATLFGRPLGFTDEHLYAIVHSDWNDPVWDEREKLLIETADELFDGTDVSDSLWDELTRYWANDQLLEIVITAGWYRTVSLVINVSGVELEDWAERFPPSRSSTAP